MSKSLAIKYRPKTFDDVVEQGEIKIILQQQLENNDTKNAYLFCGGAGTGKTTCARIFANEINKHKGNPIEIDAASHSSVEDARDIIQQAKTKSLDSEYKVFIIDECHSLSNTAWQALLKLLEEPPIKSVFIFCTTDPQKIPKTILSRVQRYDFQRISTIGIYNRLKYVVDVENEQEGCYIVADKDSLEYVAKVADGGMRDALTMLDKCIAYSEDVTLENVVTVLNLCDYDTMLRILRTIHEQKTQDVLLMLDNVYKAGVDLKQFVKQFTNIVLDVCKYSITRSFDTIKIPNTTTYANELNNYVMFKDELIRLLSVLTRLNADIKWDTNPRPVIEVTLLLFMEANNDRTA